MSDPWKGANPLSVVVGFLALQCAGSNFWTIRDRRHLARRFAEWRQSPHGTALYITPEGTISNGRGLFRFESEFLTRGMPVVPVAIRLKTPFGLRPHPLHDSGFRNAFRLLAMPWLHYEVTCMPRMVQVHGQDRTEFARQVQQTVAGKLGIPATEFGREDKHAYRSATTPADKSGRKP